MANKIGEKQFHIMCKMWGVDEAIKTVNRMGMNVEIDQIEKERHIEAENNERWADIFKDLHEEE